MDWQEVKAEFAWEGSWLDLYILETDRDTWQNALDFLRDSDYPLASTIDGEERELPAEAAGIFRKSQEANAQLRINVHGVLVNCHFFVEEEIGFDIDPRDVGDEAAFNYLCGFMQQVGQSLGRSVILTPENSEHQIIIRYLPTPDQFQYTPVLIEGYNSWPSQTKLREQSH